MARPASSYRAARRNAGQRRRGGRVRIDRRDYTPQCVINPPPWKPLRGSITWPKRHEGDHVSMHKNGWMRANGWTPHRIVRKGFRP